MIVQKLLSLFSAKMVRSSCQENEELFTVSASSAVFTLPDQIKLIDVLNTLPGRDSFRLEVIIGTSNPVVLTSVADIKIFIEKLADATQLFPSSGATYWLAIEKKAEDQTVSVYRLSSFRDYLFSLDMQGLFEFFNNWFIEHDHIIFQLFDNNLEFNSDSIFFSRSAIVNFNGIDIAARKVLKEKSDRICHYGQSSDFCLYPSDFITAKPSWHPSWNTLFNRLAFVCSVIRLFDITDNTADGISFRLNGYKAISGELKFCDSSLPSLPEYLKIVEWLYQGGNLNDKIGLARNLISLHLTNNDSLEIKEGAFNSIRSGFDIYLKENIKQYIEVRSKVQDQLLEFNKKAGAIIDAFGAGFQKSALAVLTFFATILISKILSGGKLEDTFTFDAYLLNLIFLAGSTGYLLISIRDVDAQITRFDSAYNNIKARFGDLLTAADIENILGQNREHDSDMQYMRDKRLDYLRLWVLILALIFIVTTILHGMYVFDNHHTLRYFFLGKDGKLE